MAASAAVAVVQSAGGSRAAGRDGARARGGDEHRGCHRRRWCRRREALRRFEWRDGTQWLDPKATTGRFKSWFLVCQVGSESCSCHIRRGFREIETRRWKRSFRAGPPPRAAQPDAPRILLHTMTTIWRPHWLIKPVIPVKEEVPDDDVPDVKVEPPADDEGINAEDEKTHQGKGAKRKRAPPTKGPCEHGVKYRSRCKVCSACPHGRQRSLCKECGGRSICEHGRQRYQCKECGGKGCLLYTSPSPRDQRGSRMPSSA